MVQDYAEKEISMSAFFEDMEIKVSLHKGYEKSTNKQVACIMLGVEMSGLLRTLGEQKKMTSIAKYVAAQHLVRFCKAFPFVGDVKLEHTLVLLDADLELLFGNDNIPLTDELIKSYAQGKVVEGLLHAAADESKGALTLGVDYTVVDEDDERS